MRGSLCGEGSCRQEIRLPQRSGAPSRGSNSPQYQWSVLLCRKPWMKEILSGSGCSSTDSPSLLPWLEKCRVCVNSSGRIRSTLSFVQQGSLSQELALGHCSAFHPHTRDSRARVNHTTHRSRIPWNLPAGRAAAAGQPTRLRHCFLLCLPAPASSTGQGACGGPTGREAPQDPAHARSLGLFLLDFREAEASSCTYLQLHSS